MNYRYLGKTGLKVSELCMGTMTFGRQIDEKESHGILDAFASGGGNFIDTADVYSGGNSEKIVGSWLEGKNRDEFVIATKVRGAIGEGQNRLGLSRKHVRRAVRDSLDRLKTDYIDLYQVHAYDPATSLEETLRTMSDLVDEGLVLYIGASNFRGWQLQKSLDISNELGLHPFCCLQPQYSLMCRATEFELMPVCTTESLGVIPWSPLKGGWLSGKYNRDMKDPPAKTRLGDAALAGDRERWETFNNERTWEILEKLKEVASREKKSMPQTALNWLLQKKGVTAPIIGARSLEQLHENMGASGWSLSNESMRELDEVSRPDVSYPYDEFSELQQWRGREDYAR